MKLRIVSYRPALTERARELRRKMTLAEVLLWKQLKGKQLCGYDFDRQKPLGCRIVDFFCKDLALAVDVDGSVHNHAREKDEQRHREIESLGVTHLRFWNSAVKNDLGSVTAMIERWIRAEEKRRGWPRRESPVKVSRSRRTRVAKSATARVAPSDEPTPDPSKGGEQSLVIPGSTERANYRTAPNVNSLPGED